MVEVLGAENVTANPDTSLENGAIIDSTPSGPSSRVAMLALMVSFCIMSALWGWFLYCVRETISTRKLVEVFVVFTVIMAGVHFIGYRLWRRQFVQGEGTSPLSSVYWPTTKAALLQQGIIFILAALILDGGLTFHMAVIAFVAYWSALGIIVARRPSSPTRIDILLVRYGFLLVFLIVVTAGPFVWKAMGRL